jgi:hypothetical protein
MFTDELFSSGDGWVSEFWMDFWDAFRDFLGGTWTVCYATCCCAFNILFVVPTHNYLFFNSFLNILIKQAFDELPWK